LFLIFQWDKQLPETLPYHFNIIDTQDTLILLEVNRSYVYLMG
jgi:hypothetical protein